MKLFPKILFCLILISFSMPLSAQRRSSYNIQTIFRYYRAKNFDKAKRLLERWMIKSPQSFPSSGFLILGNIYDHLKLFPAALQIYQKGMATAKNKFPFYVNISQVYRHMKKYKEAIAMLDKVKDKGNIYPEIYLFLGMSHFELRKRVKTIIYWKSYLNYKPRGKKSDKVRRALAWLNRKDFKWPEELAEDAKKKKIDLEKFLKDLKKTVNKENEKNIKQKPGVKEGKLDIKDKGKKEGDKFDEVER